VSWGTKGDNKVSTDLGVVKANKGENAVEVAVPTAETDINSMYEDAIHVLSTKPPKEEKSVDQATAQEDYYRNFRTKCVFAPLSFLDVTKFYFRVVCCCLGCYRMWVVDLIFATFCKILMVNHVTFQALLVSVIL
jgi:hypothetical protein